MTMHMRLRDDDGGWVTAGDTVHFSYSLPPVGVDAPIIEQRSRLQPFIGHWRDDES